MKLRHLAAATALAFIFHSPAQAAPIGPPTTVRPELSPFNAKFDDTSDDTKSLNAALAAAAARGSDAPMTVELPPNGTAKISGHLVLDIAKVRLDCNGSTIDARGLSDGALLTLTSSQTADTNSMGSQHGVHPMSNCILRGPVQSSGVDAIHFQANAIGGAPWMWGAVLDNVWASGFKDFYQLGGGTFDMAFDGGGYFGDGLGTGTAFDILGGSNAGENIRLDHFWMSNITACFNDHNSSADNVDIYADATSCDGANYILTGGSSPGAGASRMTVFFSGHIEDLTGNHSYAINVSNGGFVFSHGEWIGDNNVGHTICNVTAGSPDELGVRLEDVEFNGGKDFQPFGNSNVWCDGNGPFLVRDAAALGNTELGLFAASNNLIANWTNPDPRGFSISGAVTGDATTRPPRATSSIKLSVGPAGGQSAISFDIPCRPGQKPAAAAMVRAMGVRAAARGEWGTQLQFLDSNGRRIGPADFLPSGSDMASWTFVRTAPHALPAPPGTAVCQFQWTVLTLSGAANLWVGLPEAILQ